MSELTPPLPLPEPSQFVKERADLRTTWEAINEWHAEAVSPTGVFHGNGYRHYGGPILLGLKYLGLELKSLAKNRAEYSPAAQQGLLQAAKAMMMALLWAQKQPGLDALYAEFSSSLELTVSVAHSDYDWLFPVEEVHTSSISLAVGSSH